MPGYKTGKGKIDQEDKGVWDTLKCSQTPHCPMALPGVRCLAAAATPLILCFYASFNPSTTCRHEASDSRRQKTKQDKKENDNIQYSIWEGKGLSLVRVEFTPT